MIDVALAAAGLLAVGPPHRLHVVVERQPAVGAVPQREIERQRDRAAERVVRDHRVRPVGTIDGAAAVDERRHRAHLRGGAHQVPRPRDALDQPAERSRRRRQILELRPLHRQRPVVLRETFREPERVGQVGAIEVERLEPRRADALDVPAVEELVRDRVEQVVPGGGDRAGGGDDRAVAMLHAVAVGVRQVVGEEGVIARLVVRVLAVDRAFLPHDLLDVLNVGVELGGGAGVVQRETEGMAADGELADAARPELRRAVHQVLQVRRGELERRRAQVQLGRDLPAHPGRLLKGDGDRTIVETVCPHDRRRHVDVRVRGVHREIGPVHAIAEHLVLHCDAAAVSGHVPAVGIRPGGRQFAAVGGEGVHVVDVLREVMQRVTPRRRPAHAQLQRAAAELGERRLDLHPAMLRFGERERVADRGRGVKRHGRGEDQRAQKKSTHHRDASTRSGGPVMADG